MTAREKRKEEKRRSTKDQQKGFSKSLQIQKTNRDFEKQTEEDMA